MGLVLPVLASFLVSYLDDSGRVSRVGLYCRVGVSSVGL